jgi:hypothetical protein
MWVATPGGEAHGGDRDTAATLQSAGSNDPWGRDKEETGDQKMGRMVVLAGAQLSILAIFSSVYTELGFGATIYRFLASHHDLYNYTSSITLGVFVVLYLLDFRYWAHTAAAYSMGSIFVLAFLLSAAFIFKKQPHAPVAIFYCGTPLVYCVMYRTLFAKTHLYNYMMTLSAVLLISGAACTITTLIWAAEGEYGFGSASMKGGFWWGAGSKLEFRARLRVCDMSNCTLYSQQLRAGEDITASAYACPEVPSTQCEVYDTYGVKCLCLPEHEIAEDSACEIFQSDDPNMYAEHCLAAFMLWACPFIGSVITLVFGIICALLARTVDEVETGIEGGLHPGTKLFINIMVFGVLGLYTAASIAGASMKAASLVTWFAFLTIGICVFTIGISIGWQAMEQQLDTIPIVTKLQEAGRSDILKAIAVMVMGVPGLGYLLISFINQMFRRILPCTRDVKGTERTLVVTQLAQNQLDAIKHWNWTSVLSKVIGVGFVYFIFFVGVTRFTFLGLSALNAELASKTLLTVTFVYMLVGWLMFLLPPVPGIPVYLTGGIVLAKRAMQAFCDEATEDCGSGASSSGSLPLSFWLGVGYASIVACMVKALAILGQQKVIGAKMGNKVAVRRMVGVNSVTIRAIKKILKRPGLPVNKMLILVGGPDWPTSVLTGILGLSYKQMVLGSSPFLVTISITVLAGALMNEKGGSPELGAAASAMLFIASLVQGGCLMAALVAIQDVAVQSKDELMAEPMDEEVLALDKVEEAKTKLYNECTHWTVLPKWIRGLLISEFLLMNVSLALFVFQADSCFYEVEVTTDIMLAPLYGDAMKLVRPLGRIGFAIHFAAVLLHYFGFARWAGAEVAKLLAAGYTGGGDGPLDEYDIDVGGDFRDAWMPSSSTTTII